MSLIYKYISKWNFPSVFMIDVRNLAIKRMRAGRKSPLKLAMGVLTVLLLQGAVVAKVAPLD